MITGTIILYISTICLCDSPSFFCMLKKKHKEIKNAL